MARVSSRPVGPRTAERGDFLRGRLEGPGDHLRSILACTGLLRPNIIFLGAATLVFGVITVLLSLACGAPFVIPIDHVNPALGLRPAVPLEIALVGCLVGQVVGWKLSDGGRDYHQLLQRTSTDLVYVALFMIVIYLHFHIKMWMPLLNSHLYDASYFQVDQDLRPVIAGIDRIRAAVATVLPAADLWYQGAQLGLFIGSFWLHGLGRRRWHHHNLTALLLNLMVGALAYLIAPAVGPFIFEPGRNRAATAAQQAMYAQFTELQAQGPSWLLAHGGDYFTAPLAAMPSLHTSAACIVCYYAIRARSPFALLMIFFGFWILIDAVGSRWHYLVDLPAGVLLAVSMIAVTHWICRERSEAPAAAGS